jgi:hypothetical protein
MTRDNAHGICCAIVQHLDTMDRARLKSIHVVTRLHDGMITFRLYFVSQPHEDPAPFIFDERELS